MRWTLFIIVSLAVCGVAVGVTGADEPTTHPGSYSAQQDTNTTAEFQLNVSGSFRTPAETVTVEGEQFTVRSVTQVQPDENLVATVTAPPDTQYTVNLYTLGQQIQTFRQGSGTATVQFELGPSTRSYLGSYVLAVVDSDNKFRAVKPVVVADQQVSVSVPKRAPPEEPFGVRATLSPIRDETTPGSVELAVYNDSYRDRIDMVPTGDGYAANVTGLANGTYRLFAAAIDTEQINGENNVIGLSEPTQITVDPDAPPATGPNVGTGNQSTNGTDDTDDSTDGGNSVIAPAEHRSADETGVGFGVAVGVVGVCVVGVLLVTRGYGGNETSQ